MKNFFIKVYFKFLDVSQTILFFASGLLILYMFVIQPHEVSGSSMYPTFHDKEFLLSYLLDVRFHLIYHGDVVVFHAPKEADKLYIKRVIGLPGDKVKVEDGLVYVNGKKLDEKSYLNSTVATYGGTFLHDGEEITVPSESLCVMGDNRPFSSDSREWGFVSFEKLIGRSMVRIWPPQTLTWIPRNPYK